jgi:hypothetical protein
MPFNVSINVAFHIRWDIRGLRVYLRRPIETRQSVQRFVHKVHSNRVLWQHPGLERLIEDEPRLLKAQWQFQPAPQ